MTAAVVQTGVISMLSLITYVHEEFRRRKESNGVCSILHQGKTVASVIAVRTVINSIASCKLYFIFR